MTGTRMVRDDRGCWCPRCKHAVLLHDRSCANCKCHLKPPRSDAELALGAAIDKAFAVPDHPQYVSLPNRAERRRRRAVGEGR